MNTRPLPELSNLLDSDVLTCFLIFWLYHTQSIIQSAGRQRNTGAQSISSWQTFVFTSKVGRKKKVGEREHLTIPCLQLPKLLQGFGLVSLKYPKENLSEKQRELHRFIAKQDPTSGTGRAVWGFKCRVSACTAAFKPAYALAGFYLAVFSSKNLLYVDKFLCCLLSINLHHFACFVRDGWISEEQGQMNPSGELIHSGVAFTLFISENIMLFRGKIWMLWCLLYIYNVYRKLI